MDMTKWGERRDLNPRPLESQSSALPAELRPPSRKTILLVEIQLSEDTD